MASIKISIESGDAVKNAEAARQALRNLGAQASSTETQLRKILETLGSLKLGLGPDPLGVRGAASGAEATVAEHQVVRAKAQFGAGLEAPFGAGLVDGSFTASELGLDRVASAADVAAVAEGRAALGAVELGGALRAASSAPDFGRHVASANELAAATIGAADRTAELFSIRREAPAGGASGIHGEGGTVIDSRGLEMLAAQESGIHGVQRAAEEYGSSAQHAAEKASSGFDLHYRSILRIGAAFLGLRGLHAAAEELIDFQQGLVGVHQATGLAGSGLGQLRDDLIALSTSGIPVATDDLLKFAESAGRLQIRTPEGIKQFVADVALLRTIGPEIGGAAQDVGNALGQFLRNVGEAPSNVKPLADSVAFLDDEFGVMGTTIFATAQQIAQAGAGFVKSSADALGLGAAMASMGVDGGLAGTAIAQVMIAVRDALANGGKELRTLSELTGKSGEQIRAALATDAATLFTDVLEGLAHKGAGPAAQAMDDLGLAGVRQAKILGPLLQNYQQVRRAIDGSREAQVQGTAAEKDAAEVQATLASQLANTKNLFIAATGANEGLVASFGEVVGFGNQVASVLLGVADAGTKVSQTAELVARGLEAAAIAGGTALVVERLSAAYQTLAATTVGATTAQEVFATARLRTAAVEAAADAESVGVAGARGLLALGAFFTGPAGIAVGAAVAVAALLGLRSALRDVDDQAEETDTSLEALEQRMRSLDAVATGLAQARDLVFRARLDDDVSTEVAALQQRLRELSNASTAIAGELRVSVDAHKPEFAAAVQQSQGGADLSPADVQQRAQKMLDAAVLAVHIPELPQEKQQQARERVAAAFDGIAPSVRQKLEQEIARAYATTKIPTRKLEGLKLDVPDIAPELQAVQDRLGSALASSLSNARMQAIAEASHYDASETYAGTPARIDTISRLRDDLVKQVDALGPDVGARLQSVLDHAVRDAALPGLPQQKGLELSTAIHASFELVGAGVKDDDAVKSISAGLHQAGLDAKEAKALIDAAMAAPDGEVNAEGLRLIGTLLEQAGVGALSAERAFKGVGDALALTQTQLDAANAKLGNAPPKFSQFYIDETKHIREAIRQAELSMGELAKTPFRPTLQSQGPGADATETDLRQTDTVVSAQPEGEVLRGFAARREALRQERQDYEDLIATRLNAKEVSDSISEEEAAGLRQQADALLDTRDAALLYAEAQRQLGVEQDLLSRSAAQLEGSLRLLGLGAQGETAQAFAIMRRQIQLTRAAAERGIEVELKQTIGGGGDEGHARATADAQRQAADEQERAANAAADQQEWLVKNKRGIDELANSARSFGDHLFNALTRAETPAQALKGLLLDSISQPIKDTFSAGFLKALGGNGDPQSRATQAAERIGVRDLLPPGPELALPPELTLPQRLQPPVEVPSAAELPDLAPLTASVDSVVPSLLKIGPAADGAAAALGPVGPASEGASAGVNHLGSAAELAAQMLERLSTSEAAGIKGATPLFPEGVQPPESVPVVSATAVESLTQGLGLPPLPSAPSSAGASELLRPGAPPLPLPSFTSEPRKFAPLSNDVLGLSARPSPPPVGSPAFLPALGIPRGPAVTQPLSLPGAGLGLPRSPSINPARPSVQAPTGGAFDLPRRQLDDLSDAVKDAREPMIDLGRATSPAGQALAEDLTPAVLDVAKPLKQIGANVEGALGTTKLIGGQGAQMERDVVARSGGGFAPFEPPPTDLGDKAATSGVRLASQASSGAVQATAEAPLAAASEAAVAGLAPLGPASESATAGLATLGPAGESAGLGLSQADIAALELVTSLSAASAAATDFAIAAGASAVTGAPVKLAFGGVVGGSAVRQFADGGLPSVSDLSGSVVRARTFAEIGEGDDDEAIMPLDDRGGVRGVGSNGRPVSLPLARDGSGKLGVHVDMDALGSARRFAYGGVPGGGGGGERYPWAPAASSSSVDNSRSAQTVDQRQTQSVTVHSSVVVNHYGRDPVRSGIQRSQAQAWDDFLRRRGR